MDFVVSGEYMTNCYIIDNGEDAILIDPGVDFSPIKKYLDDRKLVPKYVLITHGHFDHIGSVSTLQKLGASVYVSATEYRYLKLENFLVGSDDEHVEPFEADVLLDDGEEFSLLGHVFRVISTPGHTPGGVCYIMDGSTIFSGDTLFRMSVGRWDFKYGDGAELVKSLRKIFALPGDYVVYPGHGASTTLDFERKHNPYAAV